MKCAAVALACLMAVGCSEMSEAPKKVKMKVTGVTIWRASQDDPGAVADFQGVLEDGRRVQITILRIHMRRQPALLDKPDKESWIIAEEMPAKGKERFFAGTLYTNDDGFCKDFHSR